mgnify:FL=1
MKVKLKRLYCAALALVLALPLAACGGQQAASTPTPGADGGAVVFTRENMPRLDGSTATAPLAQAAAAVLLGESEEDVADLIDFSRTTESYRQLMQGNADLLIAAEPNAAVFDEMEEAGFEVQMEPLATDALVFMVNEDNPVDSLTTEQLRGIYSGEITNWSEVGGADLDIVPFQRNAESGSQVLMEKLVMDGTEMTEPPEGYMIASMVGLMDAVKEYDNSSNAIGYSVYYYAHDMQMAGGLKLLKIDGVAPEAATIRSGEYPFLNPYYVAMNAAEPEGSMTRVLYDWLLGPDGQKLVDMKGYVSVNGEG